MNRSTDLKTAVKFHGHLGPYLVLGLLAGELALKKLKAEKYFGIKIKVWGAGKKPKSCLIDGLQLSSGATYGKGNIHKFAGNSIRISFKNLKDNKDIALTLKAGIINKLEELGGHSDSELYAKQLYKTDPREVFNLTTKN